MLGSWGHHKTVSPGLARLVDTATGQPIGPPLALPSLTVRAVAFSPDGNTVATAYHPSQFGGGVQLWDARTGKPLHNIPLTNYGSAVAFSADSKLLATGDFHQLVKLWDVANGKPVGKPLAGSGRRGRRDTMRRSAR